MFKTLNDFKLMDHSKYIKTIQVGTEKNTWLMMLLKLDNHVINLI